MPTRNVIIDCDTGVDDALALLLALRCTRFNVLGITTVAGNVPLDRVVPNTLTVVEHSGKQVPVYRGMAAPLMTQLYTAEYAHGRSGLGDQSFPAPKLRVCDEHAVDFLVRTFMEAAGPVELITTGPLTNIGMALLRETRLNERIPALVMMAGGLVNGNSTAAAEFNIHVDPEAADVVFRSKIPKKMVALEPIVEGATIAVENVDQLEKSTSPWCEMASRLLRWYLSRWNGPVSPCDPAAMAIAIDPSLAKSQNYHVVIETRGEHTRGMTLVDRRRRWRSEDRASLPNVEVVLSIDTRRYRELFVDTLLG
jgi:inosine-uridine nucleoside N-ribohydrolase